MPVRSQICLERVALVQPILASVLISRLAEQKQRMDFASMSIVFTAVRFATIGDVQFWSTPFPVDTGYVADTLSAPGVATHIRFV